MRVTNKKKLNKAIDIFPLRKILVYLFYALLFYGKKRFKRLSNVLYKK